MQIILLEKITNVGNLGDVVKVKDGFARNFLIPQCKAKRATPENLKAIEARRTELEKAANETLTDAQSIAAEREGKAVQISQKAGVDGRLFGSVGTMDVVEALKGQGLKVEKSMVRLPNGPLKQVGDHPVTVVLHSDVTAHVTVTVVADAVGSAG